jgi:hypothetical protein
MKLLSLTIPKPCSEKWNSFTPVPMGGFCSSCSKVVTDFTTMTDEQIITALCNSSRTVCGRFRPDQLRNYGAKPVTTIGPGFTLLRAGVMGLLILLISRPGSARMVHEKQKIEISSDQNQPVDDCSILNQTSMIRGIVRDKYDHSPVPGVNVIIKGTEIGTMADVNGLFELRADFKEGDVLLFTFIGYETKEYLVPKSIGKVLEIDIELFMDVSVLGEVAVNDVYQNPATGMKGIWYKIREWF